MAEHDTVAIVGVGLIGGSIGRALRERRLARRVVGIGRRESSLEAARQVGAFDVGTINLAEGVKNADLVIVATPVGAIVDAVLSVASASSRAIITDAGSTKAEICRSVRQLAASADPPIAIRGRFVGSHPLAGDHRAGPQHARADLFDGRTVVVTPEGDTPPALIERVQALWQSLGAEVVLMSPEEHDRAVAATSHLPHLVAAALAAATPEQWLRLAATGWADTTRIAASDPQLWSQIFQQNRQSVLDAVGQFEHRLDGLKEALTRGNTADLLMRLEEAKGIRDALGD